MKLEIWTVTVIYCINLNNWVRHEHNSLSSSQMGGNFASEFNGDGNTLSSFF